VFQYSNKSLFSNWPEGLKAIFLLAISIAAFLFTEITPQLVLFTITSLLLAVSGYRDFLKLFGSLIPFLLLIDFSFYFFFADTALDLNKLVIVSNLRMLSLFSAVAFFTFSTDLFAVVKTMRKMKFPEWIYLPFYVLMRFLPEIERDFIEIRQIQKIRGISPRNPVRYLQAILLPLLFTVFQKAEDISIAYYLREKREKK